jgi:hypothetical protein
MRPIDVERDFVAVAYSFAGVTEAVTPDKRRARRPSSLSYFGFSNSLGSTVGLSWIEVYCTVLESFPFCLFWCR